MLGPAISSTSNQIVWAPVMSDSRLLRFIDRQNDVTKMSLRWDEEKKILQNMPISYSQINLQSHFIQGQFWPLRIVVPCVCLSVCVSVNHKLVVRVNGDNSSSVQVGIAKFS